MHAGALRLRREFGPQPFVRHRRLVIDVRMQECVVVAKEIDQCGPE